MDFNTQKYQYFCSLKTKLSLLLSDNTHFKSIIIQKMYNIPNVLVGTLQTCKF